MFVKNFHSLKNLKIPVADTMMFKKTKSTIRELRERFNAWCDRPVLLRLNQLGVFEVPELVELGCGIRNVRGHHYGIKRILHNNCYALRGLKLSVEHGVYFDTDVLELDIERVMRESPSCLITFGDFRAARIRDWAKQKGRNFLCAQVGPYIHYADPFYPEKKTQEIKKKLGKMLLVFPMHGWEHSSSKYDIDEYIDEIKKVASSYESVCVSIYWHDFLEGKHERYQMEGWTIVSGGHRSDPYFLERLRSLIELSDMTISNAVGTHVGYCISLGKPHYIFGGSNERDGSRGGSDSQLQSRLDEISGTFGVFRSVVSAKQRALVELYWGRSGEVKFFESCSD